MDSRGGFGDRGSKLIGPQSRDADGHVGSENGRAFQIPDLLSRFGPVECVVVDIVVDRDVGTKLVVQVEIVRVRHHQPAPRRPGWACHQLRIDRAIGLIPSRGKRFIQPLGRTSCSSHEFGPLWRSRHALDQGKARAANRSRNPGT